jgi:hypothetical protein
MVVNRKLLYGGVFLIAAGTVVLVAQSQAVDDEDLLALLQLWPIAVIALGVALVVRRTRFATAGGVVAAVMPGLLLGGMVAAAPEVGWGWECRDVRPAQLTTREGTFLDAATVELRLGCGDLSVTTTSGDTWQLRAGNGTGQAAVVDASADRLSIASATRSVPRGFVRGQDVWQLALPVTTTIDLVAEIDAGRGTFDLEGARLGVVDLAVNAGDTRVDLARATIDGLSLHVNGAAASVSLPADQDIAADISVNAGAVRICAPADLGLRIQHDGTLTATTFAGLVRSGAAWESPGYSTAIHHADVTVTANVGSVDINPIGGCR